MFLHENKKILYQWEVNQKLIVENDLVKEVHFSNAATPEALVVEVVEGQADIPNILLQNDFDIKAFGYCGQSVRESCVINVVGRAKPEDYIYTETEVKRYETLEASIEELQNAVNDATEAINNKPGVSTDKGEIFNDYENNTASNAYTHAEGLNTNAGGKAFKIVSAPSGTVGGTGTYTLDSTEGLAIGMTYSAVTTKAAHSQGQITLINRNTNKVQVSNYAGYALNTEPDTEHQIHNYFMIDGKPELGTVEVGAAAHAEGLNTMASNCASHAEGRDTKAIGKYGHAEGKYTVAGHAAHAEGSNTIATGDAAHSEGESTKAIGNYTHAEGYLSEATGLYAHAEGRQTKAIGQGSHTEGFGKDNGMIVADGLGAHAEGFGDNSRNVTASGYGAHAEGVRTTANGDGAHAEGHTSVASGAGAHAEGRGTHAEGQGAHAEGFGDNIGIVSATGYGAHAEGVRTTANGAGAHAEGQGTQALKSFSHAEGENTIANSAHQHVQGKNNIADANNKYAHIVGNGSVTTPSNAHTLDWNGNAWFAGTGEFDAIILRSSTSGSTKRFKITVNDSGTIKATAI